MNFSKYKKEINDYFVQKEFKRLDDLYQKNTLFVPPFLINELSDYLLEELSEDLMDEYDNYDDLDEDTEESVEFVSFDKVKDKANFIQTELIKRTGDKGLFTMAYNLYLNLTAFLILDNNKLKTSGIILKKLNDSYTLYYVYFENNGIIIIPKNITNEEAKALYEGSKENKTIEGIPDFFNEGKSRKLKP